MDAPGVEPPEAERFDHYQERCLYDPAAGFYASGGRAGGARGDFLTSPEVGPLFGTVIARALRSWWDAAGRPSSWHVVEAGAGRGALAVAILNAARDDGLPLRYTCVERSAALRAAAVDLLGDRAAVLDELPERADVVIANELLDNLVVRIVERAADGWRELWVPQEWRPTELAPPFDVAVGQRLPVCEAAARWVEAALERAARVVVFDYGVRRTAELVGRQWLRTYSQHRRSVDPFVAPGSADITVDVAFDQLPAPRRVVTQAEWLGEWGIDELVAASRRVWEERAQIGDLAAVRARSRGPESAALCDPDGLGAFLVAEWHRPDPT